MAKKTQKQKDAAKAKKEKKQTTEDTATATQGEETEAKGEDKGTTPVVTEPEVIERPADACEVWGERDPNSRICKTCPVFALCGVYTETLNAAKPKTTSTRKPRTAHDGTYTQFGHCRSTSQAGLIELALAKPTTVEELMAVAGCTKSRVIAHLGFLNKKTTCKKVVDEGGKFHYELVQEKTPATEGKAAA